MEEGESMKRDGGRERLVREWRQRGEGKEKTA